MRKLQRAQTKSAAGDARFILHCESGFLQRRPACGRVGLGFHPHTILNAENWPIYGAGCDGLRLAPAKIEAHLQGGGAYNSAKTQTLAPTRRLRRRKPLHLGAAFMHAEYKAMTDQAFSRRSASPFGRRPSRRGVLLGAAAASAVGGAAALTGLLGGRGESAAREAASFDFGDHVGLYRSATAPQFVEIDPYRLRYFCETRVGLAYQYESAHGEMRKEIRAASSDADGALAISWWGILDPEILEKVPGWPDAPRFGGTASWNDDPRLNAAAFIDLIASNHAYFALRGLSREEEERALLAAADRGEAALFEAMGGVLRKIGDGHGWLYARGRYAYGGAALAKSAAVFASSSEGRGRSDAEYQVLKRGAAQTRRRRRRRGGGSGANGEFHWWRDEASNIGYFAALAFEGLSERGDGAGNDVAAAEAAYEAAFRSFEGAKGVVIDLRFNGGGWDEAAVGLAARVAPQEQPVFSKAVYRSGALRPDFQVLARPARGARFVGPVAVVQSDMTFSAAEIALLALGPLPNTRSFGWRSAGALSDEMYYKLPNGWRGTFSHQVYRSADNQLFEGVGVPVDEEAPALRPAAFWESFDAPLRQAADWIARQNV